MEPNEPKDRKMYHQYLIRVDDETINELQNLGFQFKTCFIWKKTSLPAELENGEMSLDYSDGYPKFVFKETKEGVENPDNDLVKSELKIVEFFIEDGCRE